MINKISLALITSFIGISMLYSQQPVTITGVTQKERKTDIKLFKTVEGKLNAISTTSPDGKGKFGFLFYPEKEGFYAVGTGTEITQQDNYVFYFKPGDKLNLVINDSAYQLAGSVNSDENKILEQWFKKSFPIMRKAIYFNKTMSTYEDFFPQFSALQPQLSTFINTAKTANPVFNKIIKHYLDANLTEIALGFLNTPRTKHPGDDTPKPDYYKTLDIKKFSQNTEVFQFPYGNRLVNSLLGYAMRPVYADKNFDRSAENMLNKQLSYVVNDTLKGEIVLSKLESMKSYLEYLALQEKYNRYLLTGLQQKRAFDKQAALAEFKPGTPGYNFKYPDPAGNEFSLASFKGKVVLVDVWATWCGPCKVEIPHLKTLEEEMKGKNVAIVSVSVDEEKDKEKWKKFIVDEKLGGTQLYAKGWSDIAKFYQINGIPRFLLFDKDGKLITHDAPRPSNPDLKKMIEKYL